MSNNKFKENMKSKFFFYFFFLIGLLIAFMWIEKWDGKLPVYGQVPTIFKDISK